MNILDIIKYTTWKDVERAITYFYPEDENNYEDVYNTIRIKLQYKPKPSTERIEIIAVNEFNDKPQKERYYSIHTNKYSLSFRDWEEIANIDISKDTLKHYRYEDIIAHFIWEITFYGDEEETKKEKEDLDKTLLELDLDNLVNLDELTLEDNG